MNLVKVKCDFCGKRFYRTLGRVNEANKFDWNQYCSIKCQSQYRLRRVEKICANPNCSKKISRLLNQFRKSKSGNVFCSLSCAASFNNSKFPKKKKLKDKCNYCGKEFFGHQIYCSIKCKHKSQVVSKETICKLIKEFYERNKRIPLKREFHHYCATRNRFGNWNNAIKAAGFNPNPVLFAKKHIANDGHKCDSFSEKIIDDWLSDQNIGHERRVPYPGNNSLSVDFVIKDIFIEFFGLAGDLKEYDKLVRKKQKICRKYNIKLVEIYPKDLFPVNRLSKILKLQIGAV